MDNTGDYIFLGICTVLVMGVLVFISILKLNHRTNSTDQLNTVQTQCIEHRLETLETAIAHLNSRLEVIYIRLDSICSEMAKSHAYQENPAAKDGDEQF